MPGKGHIDYFCFGKIIKTFGYKGELIIASDVNKPENYLSLESVFIEINKQLIPFFIESIKLRPNGTFLLKIEDIDNPVEAGPILKSSLFLPSGTLPQLKEDQFYYHEAIGFEVFEKSKGRLGKVVDIVENSEQDLLVVSQGNNEILIPLVDEFIISLDKNSKTMEMELPDGLIDLYL